MLPTVNERVVELPTWTEPNPTFRELMLIWAGGAEMPLSGTPAAPIDEVSTRVAL